LTEFVSELEIRDLQTNFRYLYEFTFIAERSFRYLSYFFAFSITGT
jgi:hypothetical protein